MRASRNAALIALALSIAACGQRQVEVRTAPTNQSTTDQSVQVTNNLSQAVNVYVTPSGGSELFLRQVQGNSVERVTIQGVSKGTSVVFKAVTIDASRTYQSRNVTLAGTYAWAVP